MRRTWMIVSCLAVWSGAAWAHAHLRQAEPAVGSVGPAPQEVVLHFSERLEPSFSRIEVLRGAEHLEAGPAHIPPGDARVLAVPVKPLAAGVYTVLWHATSVDTHKTEGHFTFTVAP